ncbi:MAG: T9SS type A sorting domain-containing protein, partial [Flavobacteriales bacterium]|nr:T9SS type A sorting domain-containing protein [Flavobacteriales bacterium]
EIIADSSMADGHLLVVESGGLLNITGADTWSNFSVWNNNYDLQPNSSVAYSHTGDQTLPDSLVYSNLVLSGSGNKTLSPTASGKLKVTGNLSIQDAAVLQPNSLDINLSGSWSSYGESAFNESGVSVVFDNATGSSTISCGDTERFDDLVISGEVMLNSSIHVLNSLDLSSRVDLNSNEVIIEEPVNTNISSGAGYFVSEDVLHRGRITNVVNGYTGPVDFPFGTSSGTPIYCRTTLTSGTLDTISMATYPTDVNNLPLPSEPIAVTDIPSTSGLEPDNREATANRFWSIESDGTSFTVDLELALDSNEVPTTAPYNDIPTLVAQRYQSSTDEWQPPYPDQSAVLGGPSPRTVTISIDDVDAFSAWGVASSSSPLPVELLSYSGKAVNEGVQLNWTTASEVNNSHFELRRFSDVGNETWIGSVNGNGYSTSQLDYAFLDREPVSGWNYYRLIQHDFDGTIDDLGVINVLWDELQASEIVFTQWRDGLLSLRVNSDLVGSDLIIFNSSGRIISTAFIGSELMEIPFAQSEGIYLLRIEKDSKIITKKLGR